MCSVSYEDDVTLEEHPVLLPAVPMVAAGDGEVLRGWPRGRETIRASSWTSAHSTNCGARRRTKASGSRCFRSDWTTGFWCTAASTTPTDEPARSSGWSAATTLSEHVPDDHGAGTWRSVCIDFPGTVPLPQGSRTNDRRLSAPPEAVTQTALSGERAEVVVTDSPKRLSERRGGHGAANRVSVDAMKSSLVRPSGQRRPCAPAAQNRLRCSGRGSTTPSNARIGFWVVNDGSHGDEHSTYLQDAREVEGLVARMGREAASPLQRTSGRTRSQGRVPAFSGSVGGFPGSEADLELRQPGARSAGRAERLSGVGVPRRRRSHGAAADHALLGSPRRHGTYVVRWTSRVVAHARSVTC